jgi:cell division protein ZapA (FtsZ GTPase activity inhibitor)
MDGAERKSVRVTIFNQTYNLGVAGDPAEVEAIAHTVDELMTGIAAKAGNVDAGRIAVLTALHLADQLRTVQRELSEMRARIDSKTREFSLLLDRVIE